MKHFPALIHWILILTLLAMPLQGVFAAAPDMSAQDHAAMMGMADHAMDGDCDHCNQTTMQSPAVSTDSATCHDQGGMCHSMGHCCFVFLALPAVSTQATYPNQFSSYDEPLYLIDLAREGEPPRPQHA